MYLYNRMERCARWLLTKTAAILWIATLTLAYLTLLAFIGVAYLGG